MQTATGSGMVGGRPRHRVGDRLGDGEASPPGPRLRFRRPALREARASPPRARRGDTTASPRSRSRTACSCESSAESGSLLRAAGGERVKTRMQLGEEVQPRHPERAQRLGRAVDQQLERDHSRRGAETGPRHEHRGALDRFAAHGAEEHRGRRAARLLRRRRRGNGHPTASPTQFRRVRVHGPGSGAAAATSTRRGAVAASAACR